MPLTAVPMIHEAAGRRVVCLSMSRISPLGKIGLPIDFMFFCKKWKQIIVFPAVWKLRREAGTGIVPVHLVPLRHTLPPPIVEHA